MIGKRNGEDSFMTFALLVSVNANRQELFRFVWKDTVRNAGKKGQCKSDLFGVDRKHPFSDSITKCLGEIFCNSHLCGLGYFPGETPVRIQLPVF